MYDFEPLFENVANRLTGRREVDLTLMSPQSYSEFGFDFKVERWTGVVTTPKFDYDAQFRSVLFEAAQIVHEFDKYELLPRERVFNEDHLFTSPQDWNAYITEATDRIAEAQTGLWLRKVAFIEDGNSHLARADIVYRKCMVLLTVPLSQLIPYTKKMDAIKTEQERSIKQLRTKMGWVGPNWEGYP